jgi:hypothetical protein
LEITISLPKGTPFFYYFILNRERFLRKSLQSLGVVVSPIHPNAIGGVCDHPRGHPQMHWGWCEQPHILFWVANHSLQIQCLGIFFFFFKSLKENKKGLFLVILVQLQLEHICCHQTKEYD